MFHAARKVTSISAYQAAKAFVAWRARLSQHEVALGALQQLQHVTENRWLERFEAGDAPEDAVQSELMKVSE